MYIKIIQKIENYFPEVEKHDLKFTSLTQERVGEQMGAGQDKGDEHYLLCFVSFTLKNHETRLTKQNLYRCENPRAIQFLSFYVFCIPQHFKKKTPYSHYFPSLPLVFFFSLPLLHGSRLAEQKSRGSDPHWGLKHLSSCLDHLPLLPNCSPTL